MTDWQYELRVNQALAKVEDGTVAEKAEAVAKALRAGPKAPKPGTAWTKEEVQRGQIRAVRAAKSTQLRKKLEELAETFDEIFRVDNDDEDELEGALNELYDWADGEKVWMGVPFEEVDA